MPGSFPEMTSRTAGPRLYPVVLTVPTHLRHLRGRPKVAILSRLARVAVRLSARLTGVKLPAFDKNCKGAPQPIAGVHWSVTHKSAFVAGIVSAAPVGIDIERVGTPAEGLYRRIAAEEEWRLGRDMAGALLFYRVWTAKEAVLKAEGVGLRGLSRCRLTAIDSGVHLQLAFDRRSWRVVHYRLPNHIVALTWRGEVIQWQVDPQWPQRA